MRERDSWDKLNRRKRALKQDYLETLRHSPRGRVSSINIASLIEQARQRSIREAAALVLAASEPIVINPVWDFWLAQNQVDQSRVVACIRSVLGQAQNSDKLDRIKRAVPTRFWTLNRRLNLRAKGDSGPNPAIAHQQMPPAKQCRWLKKMMPKEFIPWLNQFKATQTRRARSDPAC